MSQPLKIHIDGQLLDEPDAKISVFDHGLLYGDGVFEGIRFYNDRVFRLDEHIDRLYDSAKAIHLQIPIDKSAMIAAVLHNLSTLLVLGNAGRLLRFHEPLQALKPA